MITGRLAPTPSGQLHLGNVCAFLGAWLSVRARSGRLLLRVEDVDTGRARPDVEAEQRADLRWLGLEWDDETARQSDRDYLPWLDRLGDAVYRCACSRRELRASGGACACRSAARDTGSWRLALPDDVRTVVDRRWGPRDVAPSAFKDPVLRRRDGVFTYNLAVVADDVLDGVSEVVRGADLLDFTAVQEVLWEALGATPPTWMHTPLVLGPDGRKLGKSHGSLHVGALREAGWTPRDVLRGPLAWLGLPGVERLEDAVAAFAPDRGPLGPITVDIPPGGRCPSPREGLSWTTGDGGQP